MTLRVVRRIVRLRTGRIFDEVGDFLRVREHGDVAGFQRKHGRSHAVGEEALQFRADRQIVLGNLE